MISQQSHTIGKFHYTCTSIPSTACIETISKGTEQSTSSVEDNHILNAICITCNIQKY